MATAPTIDLVTKFAKHVDEKFTRESKRTLITNQDYNLDGAKTVKVYKVTSTPLNDYDRGGTGPNMSRYGEIVGLDARTQTLTLTKDRSFTFAIDKLDSDETQKALQAGTALAREQREVIIPEVDTYVYGVVMTTNAGFKPSSVALTPENIYDEILKATNALDSADVPERGRVIVVTPDTYAIMKRSKDIVMNTNISDEKRILGVIGMIDGAEVVKVSASRLPNKFGFMMCHPCATVAPVKL